MPRPKLARMVSEEPGVVYFKPAGIRMSSLKENTITIGEFEAIRLNDLLEIEQGKAAEKMGISQPTFHRLVSGARKKVADAIVNGKAIRIEGGNFELIGRRRHHGRRK